jgi:hypothetical protein
MARELILTIPGDTEGLLDIGWDIGWLRVLVRSTGGFDFELIEIDEAEEMSGPSVKRWWAGDVIERDYPCAYVAMMEHADRMVRRMNIEEQS